MYFYTDAGPKVKFLYYCSDRAYDGKAGRIALEPLPEKSRM